MAYYLTQKQIETAVNRGARFLFNYCRSGDIHYVVTGSSGGLDSAITLGIAQRACWLGRKEGFGLTSVGVVLPCQTKAKATFLGLDAIKTFGAEEILIDISGWNDYFQTYFDWELGRSHFSGVKSIIFKTEQVLWGEWESACLCAQGNVKARLRMIILYDIAKKIGCQSGGIVLSTDNQSEEWMGFWTLHGDVGDIAIIQHILKGLELYDIARYLRVPKEIIAARPDDGLGIADGGDEAQLGASYPVVDRVMIMLIQNGFKPEGSWAQMENLPEIEGVSPDIVKSLAARCLHTAFKRKASRIPSPTRAQLGLPAIKNIQL